MTLYYCPQPTTTYWYCKPVEEKEPKTFCEWLKEKTKKKKAKKAKKAELKRVEWDFNNWTTSYIYEV